MKETALFDPSITKYKLNTKVYSPSDIHIFIELPDNQDTPNWVPLSREAYSLYVDQAGNSFVELNNSRISMAKDTKMIFKIITYPHRVNRFTNYGNYSLQILNNEFDKLYNLAQEQKNKPYPIAYCLLQVADNQTIPLITENFSHFSAQKIDDYTLEILCLYDLPISIFSSRFDKEKKYGNLLQIVNPSIPLQITIHDMKNQPELYSLEKAIKITLAAYPHKSAPLPNNFSFYLQTLG